jgi:hypothetical protein
VARPVRSSVEAGLAHRDHVAGDPCGGPGMRVAGAGRTSIVFVTCSGRFKRDDDFCGAGLGGAADRAVLAARPADRSGDSQQIDPARAWPARCRGPGAHEGLACSGMSVSVWVTPLEDCAVHPRGMVATGGRWPTAAGARTFERCPHWHGGNDSSPAGNGRAGARRRSPGGCHPADASPGSPAQCAVLARILQRVPSVHGPLPNALDGLVRCRGCDRGPPARRIPAGESICARGERDRAAAYGTRGEPQRVGITPPISGRSEGRRPRPGRPRRRR